MKSVRGGERKLWEPGESWRPSCRCRSRENGQQYQLEGSPPAASWNQNLKEPFRRRN